jgi:hypothetical protein
MSAFEDRLWAHLVDEHAEILAQSTPPRVPLGRTDRRLRRRRSSVVAAAGASIAAAAIAAFVVGVRSAAPAYAVTQNSDGTVTITLRDLSGVDALNTRLSQLGVPVHALLVDPNCTATTAELGWNALYPQIVPYNGPAPEVTIQPSAIPLGDTLLLAVGPAPNGSGSTARLILIDGATPNCVGDVFKPVRVPPVGPAAHALKHLETTRVTNERERSLARGDLRHGRLGAVAFVMRP